MDSEHKNFFKLFASVSRLAFLFVTILYKFKHLQMQVLDKLQTKESFLSFNRDKGEYC